MSNNPRPPMLLNTDPDRVASCVNNDLLQPNDIHSHVEYLKSSLKRVIHSAHGEGALSSQSISGFQQKQRHRLQGTPVCCEMLILDATSTSERTLVHARACILEDV